MKEVDNLHFITPTGCTFYGKNRWTKTKSILFLLISWILTPIIAIILIIIGIPILLFVLPIVITKKVYQYTLETEMDSCHRVGLCIFVFLSTFVLTPFILILALLIGIPLLMFFIYFYMPRRFITANF
jgi:E3 ubiquitin-protein ligase RNF19A